MLGRAAYQDPAILLDVDARLFGTQPPSRSRTQAVEQHLPYVAAALAEGAPLHAMTRHMLGLFNGLPGGRMWRRILSEQGVRSGAGVEVLQSALGAVTQMAAHAV